MNSQNTTSQYVCRTCSGVTNIRSNKKSNGAARNNSIPEMSVDHVNIIASENEHRPRPTQPENVCQSNTPNKKPNDTETDAKPTSQYAASIGEIDFPQSGTESVTFDPSKEAEEMQCYENSILRPKDHFNQPLTPKHLIDTVIVYAKSDYKLALAYERYLRSIASANDMSDIKIKLYTSEDFPNNDVKVVKEVVNRSMRILMLLSADFTNEMSLSFIKDETIAMIALQELPSQEHMSSSYTTIINRQRNCLRVVHTVSKKERYYRTPAGLAALRAFEFFPDNKNQDYENDIIFEFLKRAREDRLSHIDKLNQYQSLDNPHISQVSEKGRAGQFLSCNQEEFDMTVKRDESQANNILSSTDIETSDSICETPLITFDWGGQSERQNPQENTSVLCTCSPQIETNASDRSNTQVLDSLSFATSGFVSNPSLEHIAMGNALNNVPSSKTILVTNPMKHDSYNSKLPMPNGSKNYVPAKTSPIDKDDSGLFGQGDEEEDKSGDSMVGTSLGSVETKVDLDKCPIQSTQGHQNVIREDKMKDANLESLGDIRENKLSYSCPSGRSGIRTGANPEYGEYLREQLTGKTPESSNNMDNSDKHKKLPTEVEPNVAGYSPKSIHYHYHYAETGKFKREDVETDGSLGSIINIKSNTVVLGNANRINNTREMTETNNNESSNDDAINNDNKKSDDTLPAELTTKKTSASRQSQPEILSSSSDPMKIIDDESLDNNSDEDNTRLNQKDNVKNLETCLIVL